MTHIFRKNFSSVNGSVRGARKKVCEHQPASFSSGSQHKNVGIIGLTKIVKKS